MLTSNIVRPRCSKYISVVYPQAEVYNLFGWDNYILWSNVRPLVPLQERCLRACVVYPHFTLSFPGQGKDRDCVRVESANECDAPARSDVSGQPTVGRSRRYQQCHQCLTPAPTRLVSRDSRTSYNDDTTGQSLLVSGTPSSPGYHAWVLEHHDDYSLFVDLLSVPQDTLPELGTCGFSVAR
jgi:hypothetical protein